MLRHSIHYWNDFYSNSGKEMQGSFVLTVWMKHPRNKAHSRWFVRIILCELKRQLERTWTTQTSLVLKSKILKTVYYLNTMIRVRSRYLSSFYSSAYKFRNDPKTEYLKYIKHQPASETHTYTHLQVELSLYESNNRATPKYTFICPNGHFQYC